uniref:Putative DNAJ protein-like protein n=1 Tax=Trypanosoma vivax (strain Y486) TaxID=1055687 RepID=G0U6F5_TRYVY|nr:putative DNAJ protein-like protein [Trypanosoma vivax Y486]
MGLDDIDDDVTLPVTAPVAKKQTTMPCQKPHTGEIVSQQSPVDLGDLFSDLVVSPDLNGSKDVLRQQDLPVNQATGSPQLSTHLTSHQNAAVPKDPLDDFFSPQVVCHSPVNDKPRVCEPQEDLFDFSKPIKRTVYKDEKSFLDAFESRSQLRCHGTMDGPTLADLSRDASDNMVKARLLKLMNYYDVLGVSRNSSEEEIRQRFKKKALELHPDRVGRTQTPEEIELFKVMTKAHEVLCDPEQRAKYDAELCQPPLAPIGKKSWFS